jgi:hypothetical protein
MRALLRRRPVSVALALGAVALTLMSLPGTAFAATGLGNGLPVTASTPATFSFTTSGPYWSAIVAKPAGITLSGGDGSFTGTSGQAVNVIAVDSNAGRHPVGTTYAATVYPAPYTVQLAQDNAVQPTGTMSTFALGSGQLALVRDVYLSAGQGYGLSVAPDHALYPRDPAASDAAARAMRAYVFASDPAPATWSQTANSALAATAWNQGSFDTEDCVLFLAPHSGWYGIVYVLPVAFASIEVNLMPLNAPLPPLPQRQAWFCEGGTTTSPIPIH